MKKYIISTALIFLGFLGVAVGQKRPSVTVDSYSVKRVGQNVEATVSVTTPKSGHNSYKVIAAPVITKDGKTINMPDVVFRTTKGRILDFRHDVKYPSDAIFAKKGQRVEYSYQFPYKSWMDHSNLLVNVTSAGCNRTMSSPTVAVAEYLRLPADTTYIVKPVYVYERPAAEKKARTESGSAFLEFPVGSARLMGDFKNNAHELGKINNSINIVNSDRGNKTLQNIDLWGTCSPEGSSVLNAKLAQNRATAVRDYIMKNYPYATSQFSVTSTPEDWAGLADALAGNPETWARAVIKIAKSDISDDAKDREVRNLDKGVPYKFLLAEYYPRLRRVDYRFNYSIRDFTPEEVAAIYKTRPQDLSAAELYNLSLNYNTNSPEFANIIQTTVALYPNNSVANINAATLALRNGNPNNAAQYLNKVSHKSPVFYNTLGIAQMMIGDYQNAQANLKRAEEMGLGDAAQNLNQLDMKLKNISLLNSQK